jgi:1-acyl-sn-glycerol-3-phosphate acyltransferase
LKLDYKLEGVENIPENSSVIIACKHQSAWETVFLAAYFRNMHMILKKELCYIPIYGWYLPYIAVCIKRGTVSSLKQVARDSKKALDDGKTLCIFPEGTREPYGENGQVKPGIYFIHKENPTVPIVPVAINSGKFWKKGSFNVKSGKITVKFLPAIREQMKKDDLILKLQTSLNEESNKL